MGTIGFGVCTVSGRRRVPFPPASRIAFMTTTDVIMRAQPLMNLPNSLTVTRIFLVPLLVVVLLTKLKGPLILGLPKDIVGALIFGVASLTDWADGYLARRRKQITPLGQVIDPLADKLLTSAALISLVNSISCSRGWSR